MKLYEWDLETYPNCFLFAGKFHKHPGQLTPDADKVYIFEISSRVNERDALLSHLNWLQNHPDLYMVGFNSMSFDCPILHALLNEPFTFDAKRAYLEAQKIIGSQSYGMNPNVIRLSDRKIAQIDLVKINHFDNPARRTSLKALQFAMRSESVEDLPFEIRDLTFEEMDQLRAYNIHDLTETEKFTNKCMPLIEMRKELLDSGTLTGDVLNFSDVKIGVEYLVKKIGRHKCYNGSKPKQTFRTEVAFKDVILPKIYYRTEPFTEVLEWFKKQTIYVGNKDIEKPNLHAKLGGLDFYFGVGGVHASVESKRYIANEEYAIIDIDVAGMYVAVAISNGFFPEHLGQDYVLAYRQLQADRAIYKKGTTMNAVLKLAGNGVYGQSNSPFSVFYDPKYTYSVTVNGQLQLIQLAEVLSLIPGLELIQANTDGITAYVPRRFIHWFDLWKADWENETRLKLEQVEYSAMYIRDVNNYLAVKLDGSVKRKGAYAFPETDKDYEGYWNKDYSNMASIKAVEQVMTKGVSPEQAIKLVTNPFDFMLRYKTPGGSKVYIGDQPQLKTVRYYVSRTGQPMRKVSPAKGPVGQFKAARGVSQADYDAFTKANGPQVHSDKIHTKNKSRYEEVVTGIESGWLVKECNRAEKFDWSDVDWRYYIQETEKLVIK